MGPPIYLIMVVALLIRSTIPIIGTTILCNTSGRSSQRNFVKNWAYAVPKTIFSYIAQPNFSSYCHWSVSITSGRYHTVGNKS